MKKPKAKRLDYFSNPLFTTSYNWTQQQQQTKGAAKMPSAKKCTIWFDPKLDGYHVQCAYHPSFIDFLKAAIPGSERSFDPPTKTWMFSKKYFDAVLASAKKFFGDDISVISEQQVRGASQGAVMQQRKQSTDDILLEFVKLLPQDAAVAAYRKAAMLLHPDRGGDMEKMARLNVLWDRLQQEVYKP